jgi:hypothetical protein
MQLHCPNCRERAETADPLGEARCPSCRTLLEKPPNGEVRQGDLLDDVLRDIRRLAREEERAPRPVASPAAPGVFMPVPKPRRRKTNLSYSVLIALGIVLIAGVGYLAYFLIQRGIAENRAQDILARALSAMTIVRTSMAQANETAGSKNYPTAAKAYNAAIEHGERVKELLLETPRNLPSGNTKDRLLELQTELLGILRDAQAAVETPEIKYGKMGFVEYDGQWVTEAERDRLHAERMKAEGRTLYEGEWLTDAEIHERKGEVLYGGRWISREHHAELVGGSDAKPLMTPAPKPVAPATPAAGRPGFEVSNPAWMLDDFEGATLDWTNVNWTTVNPAKLSIENHDGSKELLIHVQKGNNDKCAFVRRLAMDLGSRSKLRMDVFNATGEPVRIAIALETNRFYESRWKSVTMNMNKAVTFDLKASDFKCAPSWLQNATVNNLNATRWLYILVYHNRDGNLYIDNIELLGGE